MAESREELKSLLMRDKEASEKAGLKRNIQKTKVMASGPIASWQIDGETMETVTDLFFLGSKITADGDCRHVILITGIIIALEYYKQSWCEYLYTSLGYRKAFISLG